MTTIYSVSVFRNQPGGTDSKSGQHTGNLVTSTVIELVSLHQGGRGCDGCGRQRQDEGGSPQGGLRELRHGKRQGKERELKLEQRLM